MGLWSHTSNGVSAQPFIDATWSIKLTSLLVSCFLIMFYPLRAMPTERGRSIDVLSVGSDEEDTMIVVHVSWPVSIPSCKFTLMNDTHLQLFHIFLLCISLCLLILTRDSDLSPRSICKYCFYIYLYYFTIFLFILTSILIFILWWNPNSIVYHTLMSYTVSRTGINQQLTFSSTEISIPFGYGEINIEFLIQLGIDLLKSPCQPSPTFVGDLPNKGDWIFCPVDRETSRQHSDLHQ